MRIGLVCYPTYGGSGVVATELGRFLARRGHEVHFISSAMPFRLVHDPVANIMFHEVQSMDYPVLPGEMYGITLASKIVQVVRDFNLEVVHVHYAVPHAISAFMARAVLGRTEHPFKVVTTLHGTDITLVGRAPSFFPMVQFAIDKSDAVTAVSEWLREETAREFGITRPIDVIPNFVDEEKFQRGLKPCKRSHFAPNGEKILLHISNFRPVKRLTDVIEIFARVRARMPAVLLMVGDGPDRDVARHRAADLGVLEGVRFLGKQESIELYMSCADVFLFPSQYESFGLAALEAMACELPVIASHAGGLPEVIEHGRTGFLAPVGDVGKMAEHAIAILNDPEAAARMGREARASVHNRFLPDPIVGMYEALYERVLGETSPMDTNGRGETNAVRYADGI